MGDPAPRLSGLKWLRGTGPEGWQRGHVYVLDFWATWCAPWLTQMPAHQQLQDRYADPDGHLLGMGLWSAALWAKSRCEERGETSVIQESMDGR